MTINNALIRPEDLQHYRQNVRDFRQGTLDSADFMVKRLLMGVYSQRQAEQCMVRTKLPGGLLRPQQLHGYAQALEQFSEHAVVHISTRQNIQFHHVPLDKTPDLLQCLAAYGISSREAGGNTIRNICACPLAGVCPHEHVNVQPYIQHLAQHFVHNPLTYAMPRKFKIGFSGCEADCVAATSHDLTVIARYHDGQAGFRILLGGGLGAKPHYPIVLEDFIVPEDLLASVQAAVALHNNESDRQRKKRSRVKFLIDRFGAEGVIKRYQAEFNRIHNALTGQVPVLAWQQAQTVKPVAGWLKQIQPQRQSDFVTLPLHVEHGDLNAIQLRGLAAILEKFSLTELRTTTQQDLLIPNVPVSQSAALLDALAVLNLALPQIGQQVIACPGTSTCQLGITASPLMAKLLNGGEMDLRINVNGCQNSCARSDTADIGLYGKGKRHWGKLVPSYALQLGGSSTEFALNGPEIPSQRVPQAVQRLHDTYMQQRESDESFQVWCRRQADDYFATLLADLIRVEEHDVLHLLHDHGDDAVFKVTAMGVSECAVGQVHPIDQLWLQVHYETDLRDTFAQKHKYDEAGECLNNALTMAIQALCQSMKVELAANTDVIMVLTQALGRESALVTEYKGLISGLNLWRDNPDELIYPDVCAQADAWLQQAYQMGQEYRQQTVGAVPKAVAA